MTRKLIVLISLLFVLQLSRAIFKIVIFQFTERTILGDTITSIVFMVAATIAVAVIARKKNIEIRLFPELFSKGYIALTIVVLGFLASTLLIMVGNSSLNVVVFAYNTVITVIYEEVLFRGLIYGYVEQHHGKLYALIASASLFGLWHVGYVDTVIWRTSMFFPSADIFQIMFWKAITGLFLGILLGIIRSKCNNVYPSMMVHAAINGFGS